MSLIAREVTVSDPRRGRPRCILRRLSLKIEPGEIVAVAGRPGSGKSTLVGVLSGALDPSGGHVFSDEARRGELGDRPVVSGLFERAEDMFVSDSVESEVSLALQMRGMGLEERRRRVAEALAAVDLDGRTYGDRRPFELSSGEQRRLALAVVIAARPAYLCLDEPGAGLDAPGVEALIRALEGLRSAGVGILVTGRETGLLCSLADRVLVLEDGAIAGECRTGRTAELVQLLESHGIALPERLELWARLVHSSLVPADTPPTLEAMAAALTQHAAAGRRGRVP